MAIKESTIENYLIEQCNLNNILITKFIPSANNGMPDRLLCKNGHTIFVELKKPKEQPRPLQWHILNDLNDYVTAIYINTKDHVDKLINVINNNQNLTYKEFQKQVLLTFNDLLKDKIKLLEILND